MNKYVFKTYDAVFPILFEAEKMKLLDYLGKDVIIEHIGSTAVPNLGGKRIIDIMIGIPKGKLSFPETTAKLEKAGWEHREKADTLERIFFRKDIFNQRYHLHLTYHDSTDWKEIISFRDKLKRSDELRKAYEDLKKEAVEKATGDGTAYRKLKESFIDKFSK